MNRKERLAALNGESRVFVCWGCGKVKHVKDAAARVRGSADLVCVSCWTLRIWEQMARAFADRVLGGPSLIDNLMAKRTSPFPGRPKMIVRSTPT